MFQVAIFMGGLLRPKGCQASRYYRLESARNARYTPGRLRETASLQLISGLCAMPPKSHLRQAIESFVATLPQDGPLRRVMQLGAIEAQLKAFDEADQKAIAKQKQYRHAGRIALWTMTISIIVGALALMPLDQWLEGRTGQLASAGQTIALAVAVLAVVWIAWRQPVDLWMQARAKAEAIRADIFRSILAAPLPDADALQLLKEKFACFKHAHLRSQLEFFENKGRQARKSCGRATPVRLVGYLLTAFAILFGLAALTKGWSNFGLPVWQPVLAAADWLLVPDAHRWQLGLGTIASSVLAFASARSLMDQDERNATCYLVAAEQIKNVVDTALADADAAASRGDQDAVVAFADRIQKILDAENLAWIHARPPDDPRFG
jgi:SMODS and SLOG-associating 2TM effector domain 3